MATKARVIGKAARSTAAPPDVVAALDLALKQRWLGFRKSLAKTQSACSEGAVHDLRVSTRRLLSALKVTGTLLPQAAPRKIRRRLKTTLNLLGPLRDNQVKLLYVEDLLPAFSQLVDFHAALLRREKKLIRDIGRRLRRVKTGAAEKSIERARRQLRALPNKPQDSRRYLRRLEATLDWSFVRALQRRRQVLPGRTTTIHRTRLAFKRFRYMMETLKLLLGVPLTEMKRMQAYQTRMGDIQDIEVMIAGLKEFLGVPDPAKARSFEPVLAELRRRRAQAIRFFLASADEISTFRRVHTSSLREKAAAAPADAQPVGPSGRKGPAKVRSLSRPAAAAGPLRSVRIAR